MIKKGSFFMQYVYYLHLKSGKEVYVSSYDTPEAAVRKIASCYAIDGKTCQAGEYYYFMKKH